MRYFKFSKLVRDKIVDHMRSNNQELYGLHKLDDKTFERELLRKLVEESEEASSADGQKEVLKELADVQEIIDTLKSLLKISDEELSIAKKKKIEKNGSFDNRCYVEGIGVEEDSKWLEFYLKNPEKYPEVEKPIE